MRPLAAALAIAGLLAAPAVPAADAGMARVGQAIAEHPGRTGIYVLDTGAEALIARGWLADHAERTIEVQYFIWSTDNVGILAAEALLRAAERGVRVRVIVDDLLVDAPDPSLLALARHPNVAVRIYNPGHSVGTPLWTRLFNVVTDFRGANQRMHDKTFIVDGRVAITGGRNMAAEYYDYNHEYNFRDRDALVLGGIVPDLQASFDAFWSSALAVPVERLYEGRGPMRKHVTVDEAAAQATYRWLHRYAADPANFAPEVHAAIESAPSAFPRLAREIAWTDAQFVSDRPGKNAGDAGLGGGGRSSATLAALVAQARRSLVIQSPYLVLSDEARALLRDAIARGVRVRISTNSMASTDNLQAFSGYRTQRAALVAMGIEVHEYRPDPRDPGPMPPAAPFGRKLPQFSLHAKTLVVDSSVAFVGTFNLDPRSQNLNTEVGVIVRDAAVARRIEQAIERDMAPGNSWDAARDDPDASVPLAKRAKVRFWQLLPLAPIL